MSSEKHTLVYVARHGTTDLNQKDAFRGPIDAPLDKAGLQDAHKLAFFLEGIDLCSIVHSDKKRTRTTAEIVAQTKDMHPQANNGLRAWNVGDLGGKPKNEENEAIVQWHVDNPDVSLPGGESLNQFKARVRPLLVDGIEIGIRSGYPVLIVAHSSVLHEVGSLLHEDNHRCLVEPGGVTAIYIEGGQLKADAIFKKRIKSKGAEVT